VLNLKENSGAKGLTKTQNYHHSSTQTVTPNTTQLELGGGQK
jgi:hypothetical protein